MKKFLAALGFIFLAHNSAQADVVTTDFTAAQYSHSGPITSVANLTMTLNSDGTIAAFLNTVDPTQKWYGVAINSPGHFNETNISQGNETSWGTGLGNFYTGLYCPGGCTGSSMWTIGNVNSFTSAMDAFPSANSSYDAFFYTGEQYGGMFAAADTNAVPEPTSIALLGLGLAGFAAVRRRKQA